MDCFARARNDGQTWLRDLAEWFFREVFTYSRPLRIEGAGNAGRPMRPIAVCAMVVVERTHVVRSHRNHPAFPTQWFTDYTVLSPVLGLFGHRHPRKFPFTNLTPASRCQDHTSSPSASDALVRSIISVHRILPRVRDDLEPPLQWDRTGQI